MLRRFPFVAVGSRQGIAHMARVTKKDGFARAIFFADGKEKGLQSGAKCGILYKK